MSYKENFIVWLKVLTLLHVYIGICTDNSRHTSHLGIFGRILIKDKILFSITKSFEIDIYSNQTYSFPMNPGEQVQCPFVGSQ